MKDIETPCLSDTPTFISMTGAHALTIEHSVFSVMAGLIEKMLCFSCCYLYIMLCNGLKMSEYEVCWLTDFPLIIYWACAKKIIMVISQKKQTNKYKRFTVNIMDIRIKFPLEYPQV